MCAEELQELRKREKEAGYTPDWELDAFMKAEIRKGKKESIVTDLVIKLLGLDVRPSHLVAHPRALLRRVQRQVALFSFILTHAKHINSQSMGSDSPVFGCNNALQV